MKRKGFRTFTALVLMIMMLASISSFAFADQAGYICGNGVNFRSGPGTGSSIINCYDYGTPLTINQELTSGWCKVTIGGTTGYVYGNYVAKGSYSGSTLIKSGVDSPANIAVSLGVGYINRDSVNLRSGPGTGYKVLNTFNKGDWGSVINHVSNGWYYVHIGTQYGYIYGLYITNGSLGNPTNGYHMVGYARWDGTDLYYTPSSTASPALTLKQGDSLVIESIETDGWCAVTYGGQRYYAWGTKLCAGTFYGALKESIVEAGMKDVTTFFINRDNVNIRSGAGSSYGVLVTYNRGDAGVLLESLSNGWCRVSIGSTIGYVYGEYISTGSMGAPTSGAHIAAHINGSGVHVRTSPSDSANLLFDAVKDEDCYVEAEYSDGWCALTIRGTRGYVWGNYVSTGTKTTFLYTGKPVHASPSDSATVKFSTVAGLTCYVEEQRSDGWYKVSVNGASGYVWGTFTALGADTYNKQTTPPPTSGTVLYDGMPFRAAPNDGAAILMDVHAGDPVTILEVQADGWYKVQINSVVGYIWGTHVG